MVWRTYDNKKSRQPISPAATATTPNTNGSYPDWAEVFFSQVGGSTENMEENIDQRLIDKLSKAKKTVDCAVYELDSIIIADAMIAAKNRGVQVRLVTDTDYMKNAALIKAKNAGTACMKKIFLLAENAPYIPATIIHVKKKTDI